MASLDFSSFNPLPKDLLATSTLIQILLIIVIVIVVLALLGVLIYYFAVKKKYWITIEVSRLVGNTPTRVAIYNAMEFPIGMAGDKLWRVAPHGFWKFKIIKWLPVGKLQSAKNVYKYWIREDGEWINFIDSNLDEISKTMQVKFVQEDMRLQRLATDRLLEQRLMNKTFWEKWKDTIMLIIFFLVIAVCMVVIFYQFSKLLDRLIPAMDSLLRSLQIVENECRLQYNSTGGGYEGFIPQ